MTDDFGRMPFAPEMDPLQTEIGSNQRLVTGGDLQDGAIVPDAGCDPSPSGCLLPDASDQEFFGQRQDGSIIYNQCAGCRCRRGNLCLLRSIRMEVRGRRSCIAGLVATLA